MANFLPAIRRKVALTAKDFHGDFDLSIAVYRCVEYARQKIFETALEFQP
jgi:hypothetical protein